MDAKQREEIVKFVQKISKLSPEECLAEYISLKKEQEVLNKKLEFLRRKILNFYPPDTTIETEDTIVKIIESKRKILDQKALKQHIDITPFIKEQRIKLIQIKDKPEVIL